MEKSQIIKDTHTNGAQACRDNLRQGKARSCSIRIKLKVFANKYSCWFLNHQHPRLILRKQKHLPGLVASMRRPVVINSLFQLTKWECSRKEQQNEFLHQLCLVRSLKYTSSCCNKNYGERGIRLRSVSTGISDPDLGAEFQ